MSLNHHFKLYYYHDSVTSVFFGGGTPSLAHPSTIAAVLETVAGRVSLSDEAEVTLEVNPTPVGKSRLEEFCGAGVNRFSIGVQVNESSVEDSSQNNLMGFFFTFHFWIIWAVLMHSSKQKKKKIKMLFSC